LPPESLGHTLYALTRLDDDSLGNGHDGPVYLKKAKPLDGLLRDRARPTALNKLRNRFRRRFTPGEFQRLEQRSHMRL
jgi:hypothetical protein